MQETPFLSIIVPVYDTEAYLRECLDSLLRQSFADYELVLVDDGSTDGCGALCDEYARRDGRIRVIHQANGGLSAARNAGLDAATGTYVTFVDSDDSVAEGTYGPNVELLRRDTSVDLLEYPACVYHGSPREHLWQPGDREVRGCPAVFEDWVNTRRYLHAYAWNKIYRRTLFDAVRFPVGRDFEDIFTLPRLMRMAEHVVLSGAGLYLYRYRAGSITARSAYRTLCDRMDALLALFEATADFPACRNERPAMFLTLADTLIEMMRAPDRDDSHNRRVLGRLAGYRFPYADWRHLDVPCRRKLKNLPLALFGLSFHSRLYARLRR